MAGCFEPSRRCSRDLACHVLGEPGRTCLPAPATCTTEPLSCMKMRNHGLGFVLCELKARQVQMPAANELQNPRLRALSSRSPGQ
eukprot:15473353-Alexandrium_andersonii.AAC.1